jgi:hypothetical protein
MDLEVSRRRIFHIWSVGIMGVYRRRGALMVRWAEYPIEHNGACKLWSYYVNMGKGGYVDVAAEV